MVSFFGLRFGADKKKKEPEQQENSLYAQQWKASREEVLRQASGMSGPSGMPGSGSNRPSTAQGAHGRGKSHTSSMNDDTWDHHSTEFNGLGSNFVGTSTNVSAGPSPISKPPLKPYASEANLKLGMGAGNASSSSLVGPRLPFGGSSSGSIIGPRPGSAHSTRQDGERPFLRPLDVNVQRESAPGISGPSRSPLGQFELMSPVSDNESLLGDEPEKIANAITNRVTKEEEQTKAKAELEERNRAQAELRAQATKKIDGLRTSPVTGNPSPPGSIRGEKQLPSPSVSGQQKPSLCFQRKASQDLRPGSSGRDLPNGPSRLSPSPGPRTQPSIRELRESNSRGRNTSSSPSRLSPSPGPLTSQPITEDGSLAIGGRDATNGPSRLGPGPGPQTQHLTADRVRSDSRGRPPPGIVGPIPPPRAPLGGAPVGSDSRSVSRGRSQTADNSAPGSSMLRPPGSREPVRGATVPAIKPSRSQLFQQSVHLDRPKVDGRDGDELKSDHHATNGPYGIPSPPLSNGQRSSGEVEGQAIIRDVQAKRDTAIIDGPDRESLGLQIDEFEKTLQQAQAMTALEKGTDAVMPVEGARSRGNSDGSSNYSDVSESPMTIEPPLISPQPFPLTPRPMGPSAARHRPNLADILPPTRRPTDPVVEDRSESPAGVSRTNIAGSMPPRRPTLEMRSESPAGGRPRPGLGGAPPRRPTLEEYGKIRINTAPAPSVANHLGRPGLSEYGFYRAESPTSTDSPTLKNVRSVFSPEQMSEEPSSTETSRSNSPVNGLYHSVFSPPPPAKSRPPPRSVKPEWHLGPAPTAPPTTPLPIPERNTRRKNTADSTPRSQPEQTQSPQSDSTSSPALSGLASAVKIVPDISDNPNWPLPGPGSSSSEGGSFSARRSLLPDKRAPPAPLNIAATRYDDCGFEPGPLSTLDVDGTEAAEKPQPITTYETTGDGGDKSFAIGVARGLSLKYDRAREQEKRARAKERMNAMKGAAWTIEERTSPTEGY
ncbi:hypothetical protein VPNG_08811 [Cytospora leucostoma]|uniref:Uncharacterized protein n=1 Tax=Cytospora leucostoma TaxID=1230097 RepID=A0A423W1E0_9PEZI|nr:hypothetical protein VPNG_08811 [Cytospora leucostoma]